MKTTIIYLFVFVCMTVTISAGERSGYVVNGNGEPVDFATVVLLKDGNQVAAAVTDEMGGFSFPAENGVYRMKIQNIAYQLLDREVYITDSESDLGVFMLEDALIGLDAVVVTASTITRESDRFIMQVNNSIPSLMNKDAAEVLQLAPGVWVDDEGISINGARGTKVFINNRELKLTSKELAAYLRNYRSSDIARIEVVPMAGAEYSADSKGGVIRIILRKRMENGVEGNAMVQTTQGKYYSQYRPSTTINVLSGKWTWNVFATGNVTPKNRTEVIEERFYPDGVEPGFQSGSVINSKPRLGMGRIGTIFEVNDRNSIGAEVEFSRVKDKNFSYAETMSRLQNEIFSSVSDYRQKEKDRNFSATLDYIYHIDTIGSTFKLIADYTDKKVTGDNDYQSLFQTAYGFIDSMYRNNSLSDYSIYTADAILDKKFQNGMKFKAGARYSNNNVSNRAFYESRQRESWNPLDDYNYLLDYTENIGALYSTYSAQMGSVSFLAGLRAEYTQTKGKGEVDKRYLDFFPNLNVTYAFDAMKTFLLVGQYTRNIQRPNFWHLNSNRVQYSDYAYMIGNPKLQPTYINRVSVTAVYKYRYTFTVGANLHKDLIREVTKVDSYNREVKYIIPENHYMENHYFVAISCPLRMAKWLSINTDVVGVKQDIRGVKADKIKEHYLYFINSSANITLPAEVYFELSYNGTSRLYSANSGIEPSHLVNVQLKKKLIHDRLNFTFSIYNVFNRKAAYFAYMDTYMNTSEIMDGRNMRTVKLALQYNFKSGKTVNKRTLNNNQNIKKERMEKSSGMK